MGKRKTTVAAYRRSHDYRKRFLELNPGPWRCRYCNRKLDESTMTVDHLVPVDAVSSGNALRRAVARKALHLLGAQTVNGTDNLVAACKPCNSSKGPKMGLWLLRGILGRYEAYWAALRLVQIGLAFLVLMFAFTYLQRFFF